MAKRPLFSYQRRNLDSGRLVVRSYWVSPSQRYLPEDAPSLEDPNQLRLFTQPSCARCGCTREKPCREGCTLSGVWCSACLAAAGEVRP